MFFPAHWKSLHLCLTYFKAVGIKFLCILKQPLQICLILGKNTTSEILTLIKKNAAKSNLNFYCIFNHEPDSCPSASTNSCVRRVWPFFV